MSSRTRRKQKQNSELVIVYRPEMLTNELLKDYSVTPETDYSIYVNRKYLTTRNPNVFTRRVWGCGPYAGISDLVAVLMHNGYYIPHMPYPEEVVGLMVTIRILPTLEKYPSTMSYYMRSLEGTQLQNNPFSFILLDVKQVLPSTLAPLMQFGISNDPWFVYTPALLAQGFLDPSPSLEDILKSQELPNEKDLFPEPASTQNQSTSFPMSSVQNHSSSASSKTSNDSSSRLPGTLPFGGIFQRFCTESLLFENDDAQYEISIDPEPFTMHDILSNFPHIHQDTVKNELFQSMNLIQNIPSTKANTTFQDNPLFLIPNTSHGVAVVNAYPQDGPDEAVVAQLTGGDHTQFNQHHHHSLHSHTPHPSKADDENCALCQELRNGTVMCRCALYEPDDQTLPPFHPIVPALRFSSIKSAQSEGYTSDILIPHDPSTINIIERNLDWWEIEWGDDFVGIRGERYTIKRIKFLPNTNPFKDNDFQLPLHFPATLHRWSNGRNHGWGTPHWTKQMETFTEGFFAA
ncbi:hypothetical protein BLNAU_816 [Blattamonas nauphoetae]|uniref:Uncharacterized protein n=1 Tax=Blattamonas nauphoetae TaxID=2049346 RepID=A0ABQ9YKK2_9EUKA|nr:hypothetical protein BLNAU_816 [Blattamonas nauphoetae]